jgi:hypothetical protein
MSSKVRGFYGTALDTYNVADAKGVVAEDVTNLLSCQPGIPAIAQAQVISLFWTKESYHDLQMVSYKATRREMSSLTANPKMR